MWMLVIGTALAGASSVSQLEATVLSERATDEERNRAVVELSERAPTDDEARWSVLELRHQLDPEDPVARVATAAAIQLATLEDLIGVGWPAWARGHVAARFDALLPERCEDPELWTLQVDAMRVVDACADTLDLEVLVAELAESEDQAVQRRAAEMLAELAYQQPDAVEAAVTDALAWHPDTTFPMTGAGAHLHRFEWTAEQRRAIALELVTWRVGTTLVGLQEIPTRLDAELRAVLAPELEAYGEPSGTHGWLHVLGSTGADPAPVVARLGLSGDAHWEVVLEEDRLIKGYVADALPLIAHRSPVVRARAARRLEQHPDTTAQVLRKTYRYAPGRVAPLRGDVAPPALEYTEVSALRWADTLVDWAARCVRQRDDAALRSTMWLLAEPTLSEALSTTQREDVTSDLLRLADGHPGRATDLVQAMDAILRGVPFDEGALPVEDGAEIQSGQVRWERVDRGSVLPADEALGVVPPE